MSEEEELKNEAYKQSKILYEDDDVIFLECLGFESADYFGLKFINDNRYYYRDKDIFILVDKTKQPTESFAILPDKRNKIYIVDKDRKKIEVKDILEKFPQISEMFYDVLPPVTIYQVLKRIQNGEEYDKYKLSDIDEMIGGFRFNKNTPGKSMVELVFDDDEHYFKIFDISEYDTRFLSNLFNNYYGYDSGLYSWDTAYDDWREGYIIREFNDPNLEKLKEIIKFFKPDYKTLDDSNAKHISEILNNNFSNEIDYIIGDYQTERESCMERAIKDNVANDLSNPFLNFGIFEKHTFRDYLTTVSVLLGLYRLFNNKNLTLYELMKELGHTKDVGPYEEYMYEYGCDDFDDESFQRSVSTQLDKIIEKVEDSDVFTDIDEFRYINDYLTSKFEFERYYSTPKDPNFKFSILSVSPETNKIQVIVVDKNHKREKRSLTLDEFNSMLYNLELFERKILKLKKNL